MVLVVAALAISGCRNATNIRASSAAGAISPGWPRTITDDSGASLTIAAPPKRIVSLAPSNTEILFAVGAGDRIVADTDSCDYPAEAKNRAHVGGMSAGDLEKIQVLFPDLVVAVGSINQKLITSLKANHIQTLVVQPRTMDNVLSSIRLIGNATGNDERAVRLAQDIRQRIDRVRRATARAAHKPRCLIAYSVNPIYTSPTDSFIHDLIGVAGGEDIVNGPLVQNIISPEVVIERAPEVILCSQRLQSQLIAAPGLGIVPAIKNRRFFSSSRGAELTRPGPRLAAAVEDLAAYLHPELFPPNGSGAEH
jgi:iron complex transport system substrate-binding protein